MSEGLQLVQNDKNQLLKKEKYSLQPLNGELVDGQEINKMVENISEQDYYEKSGDKYTLKGMSIAIILDPKGGTNATLSEGSIDSYAKETISRLYKYLQTKKSVKDIPTFIAVYRQNDSEENSYNGRFIYSSYCQNGKVGNIKSLDYATYIFTSDEANTNNCVIETNLASDNDLSVGDTFTITTTVNDETIIQELTIVGIYEIQSTNEIGAAHFNNPVNTIYTDLSFGQTLTGSSENITSAIYYLDDPENAEAFVELAKKKSDIDFDTFSLDANDRLYQQNASSLESMQSFAKMFVWIVVIAGSAILCLILALTIRNRYYEIGVLLSLGQSKVKIIAQQLIEIGLIAVVAFVISLGTGQLTSHYMGNMLESGSSSNVMQMDQKDDQPNDNQQKTNTQTKENFLGNMMEGPSNQELDVSITGENVVQLAGVTAAICIVSIAVPAAYVLRLTPR